MSFFFIFRQNLLCFSLIAASLCSAVHHCNKTGSTFSVTISYWYWYWKSLKSHEALSSLAWANRVTSEGYLLQSQSSWWNMIKFINICLVPKLNETECALQVVCSKGQVKGTDLFPQATGCCCSPVVLLALSAATPHCWFMFSLPSMRLCRAVWTSVWVWSFLCHGLCICLSWILCGSCQPIVMT